MKYAEDNILRSNCIKRLVQKTAFRKKQHYSNAIPKLIIQFWNNLNELPEDVQECLESWNSFCPNKFKRILFDDQMAQNFIENRFSSKYVEAYKLCHHPAMRCDYFRLCFIYDIGGFYVDADEVYLGNDMEYLFEDNILKIQPLCFDTLNNSMIQPSVFLKATENSLKWIFYVNNNPIISPPRHPIIQIALERSTNILLKKEDEYPDIQSTTGPGNLSASLVMHWISLERKRKTRDFDFLSNWESISVSKWPLSYRNDKRNWRIWNSMLIEEKIKYE